MNGASKGVLVASQSVHTSHMGNVKNLFSSATNTSNGVHYTNNMAGSIHGVINSPNCKTLSVPPSELNSVHTTCNKPTAKP